MVTRTFSNAVRSDPFHTYMSLATLSMYQSVTDIRDLKLQELNISLNATTESAGWAKEHITD